MVKFSEVAFMIGLFFLGSVIVYSFVSFGDVMLDNARLEREMTQGFEVRGFTVTYRKIGAHGYAMYFEGSRENWHDAFNDYCAYLEEHGVCEVYVTQGYPKYYAFYDGITVILVILPMI